MHYTMIAVASVTTLAYVSMVVVDARRTRNLYFTLLAVLGFLYPLGKLFQSSLVGPRWVRWYMSDVGWTSAIALLLVLSGQFGSRRSLPERLKLGATVAFLIAVCVEAVQLSIKPRPHPKGALVAAGDWADMAIFFVMYGVNLLLIWKMNPSRVSAEPPKRKFDRYKSQAGQKRAKRNKRRR